MAQRGWSTIGLSRWSTFQLTNTSDWVQGARVFDGDSDEPKADSKGDRWRWIPVARGAGDTKGGINKTMLEGRVKYAAGSGRAKTWSGHGEDCGQNGLTGTRNA